MMCQARWLRNEFLGKLYKKNLKDCLGEEEFSNGVSVVSRNGRKGAAQGNVILQVPVRVRDYMCGEGRVFVDWGSHKVKEFVSVLRCHKCYAYGHMMKDCRMKERVCLRCGEGGHLSKDCKKLECCRNCRIKGMNGDHSVLSVECPEYRRMLERERERIESG